MMVEGLVIDHFFCIAKAKLGEFEEGIDPSSMRLRQAKEAYAPASILDDKDVVGMPLIQEQRR